MSKTAVPLPGAVQRHQTDAPELLCAVGAGSPVCVVALTFDPLADPAQREQLRRGDGGVQFSHTLDEQIGGQLEAGFRLLERYEDTNGEGRLHELNIPTFLAMRSLKE